MKGKVKKFDKGWGFITGEDGEDYFFHYSSINMEGYKTVEIGEEVEFEPGKSENGRPRTEKVNRISSK